MRYGYGYVTVRHTRRSRRWFNCECLSRFVPLFSVINCDTQKKNPQPSVCETGKRLNDIVPFRKKRLLNNLTTFSVGEHPNEVEQVGFFSCDKTSSPCMVAMDGPFESSLGVHAWKKRNGLKIEQEPRVNTRRVFRYKRTYTVRR